MDLSGAKPVPLPSNRIGSSRAGRNENLPYGPDSVTRSPAVIDLKYPAVGGQPSRRAFDVQLDPIGLRWGAGDGIGTLLGAWHVEHHVLPRVEPQRRVQVDGYLPHVARAVDHAVDDAAMIPNRMNIDSVLDVDVGFDHQIAARPGDTQQRAPLGTLAVEKRIR
jgi:hypothetical protein